jgi:uncharacterized protein YbaR (Trm112 family)
MKSVRDLVACPAKETRLALQKKKEQGVMPCSKNCVDPFSRKYGFDLD